MVAVGGDDVVVRAQEGAAADGDRLLADVKVQKAADLLCLVGAQAALLEPADPDHLPVEVDLLPPRVSGRIDRRAAGPAGNGLVLGLGCGARFLIHRNRLGSDLKVKCWSDPPEIKRVSGLDRRRPRAPDQAGVISSTTTRTGRPGLTIGLQGDKAVAVPVVDRPEGGAVGLRDRQTVDRLAGEEAEAAFVDVGRQGGDRPTAPEQEKQPMRLAFVGFFRDLREQVEV